MTKSQQKWLAHIEAWKKSGLTHLDYCKKHEINPSSFSNAKTALSKRAVTNFMPLVESPSFNLTLNSSINLSFDSAPNPAWLAQLLRQMENGDVGHKQI